MTPNEETVLAYLIRRGIASDSMVQNQCAITGAVLLTIMRSLKTKGLVEQDGRYFRATEVGVEALCPRQARRPFGGGELSWILEDGWLG